MIRSPFLQYIHHRYKRSNEHGRVHVRGQNGTFVVTLCTNWNNLADVRELTVPTTPLLFQCLTPKTAVNYKNRIVEKKNVNCKDGSG